MSYSIDEPRCDPVRAHDRDATIVRAPGHFALIATTPVAHSPLD